MLKKGEESDYEAQLKFPLNEVLIVPTSGTWVG